MVELAFVNSGGRDRRYLDLFAALGTELAAAGVRSTYSDGYPAPDPGRVYVVTPSAAPALESDPEVASRTIVICVGSPDRSEFEQTVEVCARSGAAFALRASSTRELRRRGVAVDELPLGYSERWDNFDLAANRDIDLLFVGSHTIRRARHLAAYSRRLSRRTVHLQLTDDSGTNWLSPEHKRDLLARARILINLHRSERADFEWLRALDAIHYGCVLLSEHSSGFAPLEAGRHFFSASVESLGLVAERLLDHGPDLMGVARSAYELIKERRPMRVAASRLAAVASGLVGGPVPATVPTLWANGLPSSAPPVGPAPAGDGDLAVRRELKQIRLDMIELRRDQARLRLTLQATDHRPPMRVRRIDSSSAWTGKCGARVTIATPVYNHAAEIGEALESVARSAYTDFEIVVVDDGSTDESGWVVREWLRAHDHIAATLVEHPVNRGLGAARNTAIDFARGEYCLMLDADNAVYPRCLQALVARLDADPEIAFAYPILELFGDLDWALEQGASHLTNWFPWTPAWLRIYNYIDALALIRTSVLRQLGGYTTDRLLYGFEDYDLWCRVADRGLAGGLVAQVLARYRVSPSSMVALSELSLTTARAALAAHSPKLFAAR